ncbi:MAG: hypothetical protein Q9227_007068 [Pyrenula ochraceoflavens]
MGDVGFAAAWRAGIDELLNKNELADDEREFLKKSKEKPVAKAKNDIDQTMKSYEENSKYRKIMEHVRPLIEGIQRVGENVSPLLSADPYGIAPLVWSAVQLFLKGILHYDNVFKHIKDFISEIRIEIDTLKFYERAAQSQYYQQTMLQICRNYARFMFALTGYLRKKSWTEMGTSRSYRKKVEFFIGEVRRECAIADKIAPAAAADNAYEAQQREAKDIQEIRARQAGMDKSAFYGWLGNVDTTGTYKSAVKDRLEGTGDWIYEDLKVRKWLSGDIDGEKVLWMSGDPGAGKTYLSVKLIQELSSVNPTGVSYFFCVGQKPETHRVEAILQGWIHQLLRPPEGINKQIGQKPHFEPPTDFVPFQYREDRSVEHLCELMQLLMKQGKPTRLIVDGLDECRTENEDRREQFKVFFNLLANLPSGWKALIVSRNNPYFHDWLDDEDGLAGNYSHKIIANADTEEDLKMFINERLAFLQHKKRWSSELVNKIQLLMTAKASGMFMWVRLMYQKLSMKSTKDEAEVADLVRQAPLKLDDIYGQEFRALLKDEDVDEEYVEQLFRALRWITCAYRPFKVHELEEAFGMAPELQERLEKHLGSFVRIDPQSHIMSLVHETAAEFVFSQAKGFDDALVAFEAIDRVKTHMEMAKTSFDCLSSEDRVFVRMDADEKESEKKMRDLLGSGQHILLEYSALGWVHHFTQIARDTNDLGSLESSLRAFTNSDNAVIKWLQVARFAVGVRLNGADLMKDRVDRFVSLENPSNAAKAAVLFEEKMAKMKQHLGWADGGRFTRWARYMYLDAEMPTCFSPAQIAAFFNYRDALKQMLKDGFNGGFHTHARGGTPRSWAAAADACDTLALMAGPHPNGKYQIPRCDETTHQQETPLLRAIRVPRGVPQRPGSYPAAKALLAMGANVEPLGAIDAHQDHPTALVVLIEHGMDSPGAVELTEELLKYDACVRKHYNVIGSVAHLAAYRDRILILQALLKDQRLKAQIDRPNRLLPALHYAALANSKRAIQALLNAGASPLTAGYLHSAMHVAVLAGMNATEALLDTDAVVAVDPRDPNHRLPLHWAAGLQSKIAYRKLLKRGQSIDVPDKAGHTALFYACQHGDFEVTRRLLGLGANPKTVPDNFRLRERAVLDEKLAPFRDAQWYPRDTFRIVSDLRRRCANYPDPTPRSPEREAEIEGILAEQKLRRWAPLVKSGAGDNTYLPLPIVAKILRYAERWETFHVHRDGELHLLAPANVLRLSYISTFPIMGKAKRPVHRVQVVLNGKCQPGEPQPRCPWSFYELQRIDGQTKNRTSWSSREVFGRNNSNWGDRRTGFDDHNERDRRDLASLKPGDQIAVMPRVHYPGFMNFTRSAGITMEVELLRDDYSKEDREKIWAETYKRWGKICKQRRIECGHYVDSGGHVQRVKSRPHRSVPLR